MAESLSFPAGPAARLDIRLPPCDMFGLWDKARPFVTLTFAQSLDSQLSIAPGVRTILSGSESKAMTHYLRSRHAAICVGVGTAVADNPGLNCRLASSLCPGGHQPRPIVIDPQARWEITEKSKVLSLQREGQGLAPFIITTVESPPAAQRKVLESHGGKYITARRNAAGMISWTDILQIVWQEGLRSIMVEGGAQIINTLLSPENDVPVDNVIVTIAPTWLGKGGVVVSPDPVCAQDGSPVAAARLTDIAWIPLGEDVVLCGKILR